MEVDHSQREIDPSSLYMYMSIPGRDLHRITLDGTADSITHASYNERSACVYDYILFFFLLFCVGNYNVFAEFILSAQTDDSNTFKRVRE